MKLYVGNLPWSTANGELEDLFAPYGSVISAQVITDRDTGRSRGFGFVEMDQEDARRAMEELNGHMLESRALKVNEAKERPRRGGGY